MIALRIHGPAGPRKYIVMDSKNKSWRDTTETELVKPIFSQINANTDLVTAWNDEVPDGKKSPVSFAHSKGLIAFSKTSNSGFYYMHSIPKYPTIDKETGAIDHLSPNTSQFGQSVICHTLYSEEQARKVFSQILLAKPYVYFDSFGMNNLKTLQEVNMTQNQDQGLESLSTILNGAKTVLKNLKIPSEFKVYNTLKSLKELFNSKNGSAEKPKEYKSEEAVSQKLGKFTLVTKPKLMKANVFEQFLAPFWQTTLGIPIGFLIETWGRPLRPSECSIKDPLVNIHKLKIGSVEQNETQDHSKWAISYKEDHQLVCLGDLNHQASQATRGGSFLCIQDSQIYSQFASMILEHDCSTLSIQSED